MEAGASLYEIVIHDLTNAFGSVKWEAMDRAAERLLGLGCLLEQQRYRLATTTILGMDGDITLKIGEGGLMGDALMAALFWVAFLPSTIRWQRAVAEEGAESGQLLAWHPWSGGRVDFSLSQYADDTTKQIVAKLAEDVQALAKQVSCSNDVFDRALAIDGFSQNRGKEELLMHLVGEGSFADRRLVRDGKVSLPGKVVTVARYLGILRSRAPLAAASHDDGSPLGRSAVVPEQSVVELTRCFFIGRVVNTALSGIEALCPSKAQYQIAYVAGDLSGQKGDGWMVQRREGENMGASAQCPTRRYCVSGNWHLAMWKPGCEDSSGHRLWCRTLRTTQLITAMFGKLPSEPSPTLGPGGEISPEANPWAVRLMADLEELEPYAARGVIQRMGRDVRALFLDREVAEDFVAMDLTILRLRSLAVEVPPWDFREEAGHPVEFSEEGVPQEVLF